MADAQALMDPFQAPAVQAVAPILQGGNISAAANGQTTTTTIYGVTTSYFSMRNEQVCEGAFFNDQQVNIHARVAVIGPDLATTLFGRTTNLTGQTIRINSQTFTIIGVLKSKGGTSLWEVPITRPSFRSPLPATASSGAPAQRVDRIYIQATSATTVTEASTQISNIMRLRHHVAVGKEDFSISTSRIWHNRHLDHRRPDHLPGWDRSHLPAGRRDRHHEHHAGLGDRTDP